MLKKNIDTQGNLHEDSLKQGLLLSLSKIDSGNRLFRLPVGGRSLDPVHRVEASSPPTPPLSCLPFLARKYELFLS